jgi:hypothetical protein
LRNFYFCGFSEVISERVTVPNTCLILDLITSEAVHTKRGVYCMDPRGLSIEEIKILSRFIRISKGDDICQPIPVTSPAPPLEPEISTQINQIPFLPSPLLRHGDYEIQDDYNAVSRTPSPPNPPNRRGKKGKNKFKY